MGAAIARRALARAAQIIITKPEGICERKGIYLKAHPRAIAISDTAATVFSFFAGGTTIAINIP